MKKRSKTRVKVEKMLYCISSCLHSVFFGQVPPKPYQNLIKTLSKQSFRSPKFIKWTDPDPDLSGSGSVKKNRICIRMRSTAAMSVFIHEAFYSTRRGILFNTPRHLFSSVRHLSSSTRHPSSSTRLRSPSTKHASSTKHI